MLFRSRFHSPVWHPGDHPAQPPIVASGRKPNVFACGFCHRADGPGGPENANLTGLSASYIRNQMADFKSGDLQVLVATDIAARGIDIADVQRAAESGHLADLISGDLTDPEDLGETRSSGIAVARARLDLMRNLWNLG